jgi:ATP-dependent helicase/nuclease subunit B
MLSAYNCLVNSREQAGSQGYRLLEQTSRLWGYDNQASLPSEVLEVASGSRRLVSSAVRLETFARCPYQHFARHMLRLEPRPRSEVTPLENGLLAHRALEVLYQAGLPPIDRKEIEQRLGATFKQIGEEELLRAYRVDPSGRFRLRNARGQLRRFLEIEARRLENSEFAPSRYEQPFGTEAIEPLRIALEGGRELLLRGRVDRIDQRTRAKTTEALVLDYKSSDPHGRRRGRIQDVEEGFDLQLAVYLLVAEEVLGMRVIGGLYVPVLPRPLTKASKDPINPLEIKMIGLLQEDRRDEVTGGLEMIRKPRAKRNQLPDGAALRQLLAKARRVLARYGNAIGQGRIDVAPVRTGNQLPCRFCDFAPLCRIDEAYNPPRSSPLEGIPELKATPDPAD